MTAPLQGAFWMAKDKAVTEADILESLKYRNSIDSIQTTAVLFNKFNGPKNELLKALAETFVPEERQTKPMAVWFIAEYRNRTIVQIAEQHAQRGFNFFPMADSALAATGDKNRYMHVMWARDVAQERWAYEGMEETAQRLAYLEPAKLEA